MKILKDLNKKYNFRQYFESEDVKINKDILSEMSNREISKDYANLDLIKRKVTLSIKLLEEIEKKQALEKYGAEGSGKNLPFSSLSEDLKKKEKK